MEKGEKRIRLQDCEIRQMRQIKQMPVARHNEIRITFQSAFQHAVVVFIGANVNLPPRLDPLSRLPNRETIYLILQSFSLV
jgi:hypothetical protein